MESIFERKADRNEFMNRYENQSSKDNARLALGAFDWYLEKNFPNVKESAFFEQLKRADDHTLYTEVDRLVQFWYTDGVRNPARRKVNGGLSVSAVKTYFSFLKAWFRANGIKLDNGMIKDYVRWRKPLKEKRKPLDKDTARLLIENMIPKYRGYYKFVLMNGVRLGKEALGLEVRDIDFNFDPPKITVRAEVAKTKSERISFIDPETAQDIMRYNVKDKKPTDRVFDFTYDSFYSYFRRVRQRLGLTERYNNNWNFKINPYKARKYFRTNVSNAINKDYGEALIGHENISNTYFEESDEKLGQMYKAAIPELMLSNEKKLESENRTLKTQLERMSDYEKKMLSMEDEIRRMKDAQENNINH